MRFMSETLWDIWESGLYVGDNAPNGRVTVQKAVLKQYGPWRSLVFGQDEPQYEIPNVQTITIDSRHQSDAATMTLTLLNQVEPDLHANLDESPAGGPTPRQTGDLAQPGYYSFRRGITPESGPRFGHDMDPLWVDMFIPNRVIRTFQGYGTDGAVNPWQDSRLILTGTWLIDKVEYSTGGIITIHCRDALKLLIEQRLYPPIIPVDDYPLEFCADHTILTPQPGDNIAHPYTSGAGLRDSTVFVVGHHGTVYGHHYRDAFDGDPSTYWLSRGHSEKNGPSQFEYIQAKASGVVGDAIPPPTIKRIRWYQKFTSIYNGGYVVFVSLFGRPHVEGQPNPGVGDMTWLGTETIPYDPDQDWVNIHADIPYVLKTGSSTWMEGWQQIDLPQRYDVHAVRLTFTNLPRTSYETPENPYPFKAGVAGLEFYDIFPQDEPVEGNIDDYTDIIKILAAWSGFYWPHGSPHDPLLGEWESGQSASGGGLGRVWGDFAYSGAFPVEPPCIPASFWDNKSVMDGVNQIKEILGFIAYADPTGGLIWRMPNIWRTGNFIHGFGFVGLDSVREIDEKKVLIDYGVHIDDQNLRSEIHVVSADDPTLHRSIQPGWATGEVIPSAVDPQGDLALLGGQERIMLVPNYPFISQAEVDKFAYLVSLWIHWSYRKGRIRIPGNPAFEPDDQVRVYERITEESYIHYIQGVSSTMDLEKGTWYLDIDTHWLGNGPDQTWVVNTYTDMPPALYAYLRAIGEIEEDGDPANLPDGWDPTFRIPTFPDEVPRLDEDLNTIFPDPPAVNFPYDDSWSDFDVALDSGSNFVTPPTGGSGGSVNHRSERWRYSFWGSPGSDLTTITFLYKFTVANLQAGLPTHDNQTTTVRTTVPRASVRAYRLVATALASQGYNVLSAGAYAGANRMIAGTNVRSAHAWGLAIDINPFAQGNSCCSETWSSWMSRPHSPAFYAAIQRIIRIRTNQSNTRVFGWGGFWKTKKDYMHIEVVCTRAQMLEGVRQT